MARETVAAFAPGRINLIGEHTDYNGGLALPFAIAEGVTVRATATGGSRIEARALDLGEDDSFELASPPRDASGWRAFVRGVAAELAAAGLPLAGARLEIAGTVPLGAGLSSSAALEVALALALLELAGAAPPDGRTLARTLLAGRERVGRRAHRPARPAREHLRPARRGAANRLSLPGDRAGGARTRRLAVGDARLRRASRPCRLGLQPASRRVCARLRGARNRELCAMPSRGRRRPCPRRSPSGPSTSSARTSESSGW